jgi:hypothetical protein
MGVWQRLRPSSMKGSESWWSVPDQANYLCINEEIANDSTYLYQVVTEDPESSDEHVWLDTVIDPGYIPLNPIVDLYVRAKWGAGSGSTPQIRLYWITQNLDGPFESVFNLTSSWANYHFAYAWDWRTDPPRELYYQAYDTIPGGLTIYMSQVYLQLSTTSYTPPQNSTAKIF